MHLRYIVVSLLLLACGNAYGGVVLPCLFQNHMVLQGMERVPVWGMAAPGERVMISLAGRVAETVAGADGMWQTSLDLHDRVGGPYEFYIKADTQVVLSDVLVGEVWLASGQSNMEFPLQDSTAAQQEIAHAANPLLREFKVLKQGSPQPLDRCTGQWVVADSHTAGRFSAVSYYFAKEIQHELRRPVGWIDSYYGGSDIEAWLSRRAIDSLPEIKLAASAMSEQATDYPQRFKSYQTHYALWLAKYHRADEHRDKIANIAGAPHADEGWRTEQLVNNFTEPSLPFGGVVWLRKHVSVSPEQAGVYLPLHLGSLHEFDEVYWNGIRIGSTDADSTTSLLDQRYSTDARRYDVPADQVKIGQAVLTIRLFDPVAPPAIRSLPNSGPSAPELSGLWEVKVEAGGLRSDPEAIADFPRRPPFPPAERSLAGALFNAMVHPLIPYAIRGVIWFQGEANVDRAFQYRTIFPTLIQDWRTQWAEGDFPFYFCQIANYRAKTLQPQESVMAELREAQSLALSLPATGQAVTIDLGEEADIHFRDKRPVGLRLARLAMSKTYGRTIAASGPIYASSQRDGSRMRVHFHSTDGGLRALAIPSTYRRTSTSLTQLPLVRNSPFSQLEGFELCGEDHRWVWANASIVGDTVVVSSPKVEMPVAVRYAWADNPTVNLYNGAGLPAAPFRTDNFPESTRNARF